MIQVGNVVVQDWLAAEQGFVQLGSELVDSDRCWPDGQIVHSWYKHGMVTGVGGDCCICCTKVLCRYTVSWQEVGQADLERLGWAE